jgi:hypothetical protein
MNQILIIGIPLILIFSPPVLQIKLSSLRSKGKIAMPLWCINLLALALGVILPVIAMFVSMYGLPAGVKCATGCVAFAVLGFLINAIAIPVIALLGYLSNKSKAGLTAV